VTTDKRDAAEGYGGAQGVAQPPFHPLPPNGCGGCPGVVEGTVEAAEVKQDEEGAALHAADDLVERPEGVLHRRVVRERKPTAGHVPPTPRRLHGAGMKGGGRSGLWSGVGGVGITNPTGKIQNIIKYSVSAENHSTSWPVPFGLRHVWYELDRKCPN